MALLPRFDTPASLRDMPVGSPFYDNWNQFIADRIPPHTAGSGGGEFYDPTEVNVDVIAEHSLVWMGFPRALLVAANRDDRRASFVAGENRDVQEEDCEWRGTRA